jgi:DNA-binding response OmpR family regulator
MDDTPSDGNEQVVDIYIVSTEETVVVPLKERLGKKEVRVTVFADEEKLEESNPGIQPDLLICDAQAGKQEICEVIRRIKDDDLKRGIPVLVLTAAATMEDLFWVLESHADNFIAPPYDLPDNLSLINDMLTTPGEPHARGEIETRFRVRHDEKTYVFVATSRKLLDLLLSSFDIVVRKSAELSSLTTKLQTLNESAAERERMINTQKRAAETLNETVLRKEQAITALTGEGEELKKILTKMTNEQNDLTGQRDALMQHVGKLQDTLASSAEALETERELRRVAEGNITAAIQHHEDFEKRSRKGHEELERVNTDQAAVIGQLKEDCKMAAGQIQSLQAELATHTSEKLHVEQEVLALTKSAADLQLTIAGQTQVTETLNATVLQKEQTIVALTKEREELKKVLAQKTNEQNDLTGAFDALTQQAGRLQETIASANVALVTERELRRVAEENEKLAVLRYEDLAKKTRSAYEELERGTQEQAVVIGQLKEELNKASGRIQSLEADITTLATKKLYAEQGVRTLTESAALRERAITDQAAAVAQIKEELNTATGRIQSLEAEITTLAAEKLHAELEVRTLTTELGRTRTLLANEYKSHPGSDERHDDASVEGHVVQQSLFSREKNTPQENLSLSTSDEPDSTQGVTQMVRPFSSEITPPLQQPQFTRKDLVKHEPSGEIPPVVSGVISRVSGSADADDLFLVHEHDAEKWDTASRPAKDRQPTDQKSIDADARQKSSAGPDQAVQPASYADAKPEIETAEQRERPGSEAGSGARYDETAEESGGPATLGDISFTTKQWLDLLKWAHHTDTLTPNQRQKIVMMGRLVQKDGKLTKKHQEQVREILSFVYAHGYRP